MSTQFNVVKHAETNMTKLYFNYLAGKFFNSQGKNENIIYVG